MQSDKTSLHFLKHLKVPSFLSNLKVCGAKQTIRIGSNMSCPTSICHLPALAFSYICIPLDLSDISSIRHCTSLQFRTQNTQTFTHAYMHTLTHTYPHKHTCTHKKWQTLCVCFQLIFVIFIIIELGKKIVVDISVDITDWLLVSWNENVRSSWIICFLPFWFYAFRSDILVLWP